MSILEIISEFVVHFIENYGYFAIFFLLLLESACIPIPSEAILPFSGFAVLSGRLDFWLVILVGTMGQITGSVLTYFLGATEGRVLLEKYGKFVLIRKHDIEIADRWFDKHGEGAVFFSRVLPIVRTFISLPAGLAEMKFGKFLLFSILGIVPWTIALTYAGVKLGENWDSLRQYFHYADFLMAAVILFLGYKFLKNHLNKKKNDRKNG